MDSQFLKGGSSFLMLFGIYLWFVAQSDRMIDELKSVWTESVVP